MPNSLRSKLSKLRYKRQISDEEYRELTKKLNGHDKELLDKIIAEIEEAQTYKMFEGEDTVYVKRDYVLAIIDKYKYKYKAESEVQDANND